MVQLSVRHTPSSRISSTELTWEMQVSQIAWAPFQCVVKLSCAHTQQRLQKHRDSVLSPGPRCEVKWLINTQTLCNGGPAFPVRGWVDKISVDEVRWGGWGWGVYTTLISSQSAVDYSRSQKVAENQNQNHLHHLEVVLILIPSQMQNKRVCKVNPKGRYLQEERRRNSCQPPGKNVIGQVVAQQLNHMCRVGQERHTHNGLQLLNKSDAQHHHSSNSV